MRRVAVLTACSVLGGCGRFGFEPLAGSGDGGIRPPIDSTNNGDAPDSAALFDCKMSHPSAMFCDGFEAPLNDVYSYSIIDNGRAEATTTRAFRGSRALEVETFDIAAYKSARWGVFYPFEVQSGDLYIRAYYWVSSGTSFNDQASILATGYAVDPYPSTYIRMGPGSFNMQIDAAGFSFAGDFVRDQWVCLEMHIAIDDVNGVVELAVEGINTMTSGLADTRVGTGYSGVDIGIHYATPDQTPVQMWIDELIADTAPIGCN